MINRLPESAVNIIQEYRRDYPLFSLCGLNCGLCPRYQSSGASRCPGCGGKDFHSQHPSCAVINCSARHGGMAYCFRCEEFPCPRYQGQNDKDSFISYRNVASDMQKARDRGLDAYRAELDEKIAFAEYLIANFNDGRKKSFYCLAVNLLPAEDVRDIAARIKTMDETVPPKERIKTVETWLKEKAADKGIDLKLRK